MIVDHHFLRLPEDDNTKVWRYMNFTKFVSLLDSQAIHFSRADVFDDPFEGTIPGATVKFMEGLLGDKTEDPKELAAEFVHLNNTLRKFTYVNCWHLNPFESDAMWRLYALAEQGIAIQSTVARLRDALQAAPEEIHFGLVRYVDYEVIDPAIFANGLTPFIHKRKSFEHERELRAIIWMDRFDSAEPYEEDGIWLTPPQDRIIAVPMDIQSVVENVVVSPQSPEWFVSLVESMTKKHGLKLPITQSRLYAAPPTRPETKAGEASNRFSITRDVIEHLHSQHLQYTEMKIRESERLAEKEADSIGKWVSDIEQDIKDLTLESDDDLHTGFRALAAFGEYIRGSTLDEVLGHQMFGEVYLLSGRVDNALRQIAKSSITERQRDLLKREVVFLYTRSLAHLQLAISDKVSDAYPDPNRPPKELLDRVAPMATQWVELREMMLKERI